MTDLPNLPQDRASWIELVGGAPGRQPVRRERITAQAIVETALALVRTDGYDALTMRQVARALEASPGALYVHVRDKAELDQLLLGELCFRVSLPEQDPDRWRHQAADVCRQLREQYVAHPGISRVALGRAPQSLDTLRLFEGMLAILASGGVSTKKASWAVDAAFTYTAAQSLLALRRSGRADDAPAERGEVVAQFRDLPAAFFPLLSAHADELTAGDDVERFDFALDLLFGALGPRPDPAAGT